MKIIKVTISQIESCPNLFGQGENVLFKHNYVYKLGSFSEHEENNRMILVIQCDDRYYKLEEIDSEEFYLLENPVFVPEDWEKLETVIEV